MCCQKSDTTVRFFSRKGEYYSAHDSDAIFVAKDYYRTMAVVKYFGSMCTTRCSVASI